MRPVKTWSCSNDSLWLIKQLYPRSSFITESVFNPSSFAVKVVKMEGRRSCVRQIYMIISCKYISGSAPQKMQPSSTWNKSQSLWMSRSQSVQTHINITILNYVHRAPILTGTEVLSERSNGCDWHGKPSMWGAQQPTDCSMWDSTTHWRQYVGLNNPLQSFLSSRMCIVWQSLTK